MIPILLVIAAAATGAPADLLLLCRGASVAQVQTSKTEAVVYSPSGSATGSASTSEPQSINIETEFELVDGKARMHVPSVASGGASGNANWFPVSDLKITQDEFSGKVKYGFLLGSSTFRIDRRTGRISTSGGYQGTCEKQEVEKQKF